MQSRFWMAVLLGFVLVAVSACSGSGDGARITDLEEQLEVEQEARQEAEREAAEAEQERRDAEEEARQAEREAAEAEQERRDAEEEARQAEREAAEAEQERQAAEEAEQEAEAQRQAAEAERQRLQEERDKAAQAASQAQAKAAFDGLGGRLDTGTRSDPGTVSVTPRYAQTAMVTTAPAVQFAGPRRSSSGRWSITTLSNDGSTHIDDLVVYSDIGGPTQVLFTEHATYTNLFSAVANTNNIHATLTGNTHPIVSSRFPGGGRSTTFVHTIDSDPANDGSDRDGNTENDYDTTRFGGTFDGASGTFECTGACTVAHQGGRVYDLASGSWTFTTSKNARAPVDDTSYMYFGWWKRQQKSDQTLSFEMFSGGMHAVADIPDALTGTATYTGTAVGQSAIYQPLGTQSGHGSFTAHAELTADFGTAGAEGTLSGRITNFSNASDWSVTLQSQAINGGAVARADDSVSWTISGNTEVGGGWNAQFFSDVAGSTAYPEGVAGTFDAK
ncbi:MAG: hypothetical protein F4Y02_12490, partial [Chloroflexi bacterium]|nr:hypothetical protein [Chloroflexota bacterium]